MEKLETIHYKILDFLSEEVEKIKKDILIDSCKHIIQNKSLSEQQRITRRAIQFLSKESYIDVFERDKLIPKEVILPDHYFYYSYQINKKGKDVLTSHFKEIEKAKKRIDLSDEVSQLQKESYEYNKSIREQEERIRNLDEQIKTANKTIIKQNYQINKLQLSLKYWFLKTVVTALVSGFIGGWIKIHFFS
ncbi:hypothetical protein [Chondrinema litorale]|uniref:hypothetical protein n=1 Tax=Chondrinema litorale TaxID=2994555 RepID=UPI002542F914|nr:hypothetical protein [Chondrinema litorale]UZR94758.1 hypothetical protein OQ292_02875 [Chondrinema litorale]